MISLKAEMNNLIQESPSKQTILANLYCIEDNFKRISDSIVLTWGYQECKEYMQNLLMDSRDGERKGFPADVAFSLMKLIEIHQEEFPEEESKDVWSK